MTKDAQDAMLHPPKFTGRRLLLIVSGSINAALVPYWLNWLRQTYPALITDVMMTRAATRFVAVEAVKRLVSGNVCFDDWDAPDLPSNAHVDIDARNDCYAVYPTTLDFGMRLASGRANSPALMTLQVTKRPIVLATAFPAKNEVIDKMVESLLTRRNVALSRTMPVFSVGEQTWGGESGFFMPWVLKELQTSLDAQALAVPRRDPLTECPAG